MGFPGETEKDFQDTLDLVRKVGYDSAFTFLYSIRQGTPAAGYEDQIPEEVKHERFEPAGGCASMPDSAERKTRPIRVGSSSVLVDGREQERSEDTLTGRTEGFKLVEFAGGPRADGNRWWTSRSQKVKTFSLTGEAVGQQIA